MNAPSFAPVPAARLEEYSSASTLSDMEIFVFPSLLYPLVLANLMSPAIWKWRDDPWFANFPKLTPYRRILRLKQYVMDHYAFNLDLDTWGLTTQAREMARFSPFIDPETIAKSNALFGYEGDKFYFDLDIRRHFGLDKYTRDVIPYWKTETVEAMDAFRFKPGHAVGAGECVSLSTLYAAALYVLCGIPLEDIFLVATPLHSQNFIDVHDGILTNNRRLVTKAMWFNGTELSAKARRALEHEQVTIVSHCTGWIHVVYPEAGIDPDAYARFRGKLGAFVRTPVTSEILFNFLRQSPERQKCFQIEHACCGKRRWIPAEQAYAFENSCSYKVSDRTRDKLLEEMDEDDFFAEPLVERIPLNKFDEFFKSGHVDLDNEDDRRRLAAEVNCYRSNACEIIEELRAFCHLEPHWPDAAAAKTFVPGGPRIDLKPGLTREEIIAALETQRAVNPVADLAFYAFRDLARTDPRPFLKAAIERSPVCVEAAKTMELPMVVACLREMADESIYDATRAAQPDEVWNARRGDGFEKAVTLAAVLHARKPDAPFALKAAGETATLSFDGTDYAFATRKGLQFDLSWPLST